MSSQEILTAHLGTSQPSETPVLSVPIGSDFEAVDRRYLIATAPLGATTSGLFPWEDACAITYVESGRQALAVAEAELRRNGHRQIHVPSYLCDSMISPFAGNGALAGGGWSLTELPVDSDLSVRPADLLSLVTRGVVLHAPYFGRQDSAATLDALATLRRRGVVVIVDETHRVLSGPSKVADIRVASLRKLLPLYDGGYVTGVPAPFRTASATSPPEAEVAALRRIAMLAKSGALASRGSREDCLELFAKAERATQTRTQPAPMSEDSFALLRNLDLDLVRSARQANAALLAALLGRSARFRILNPPAREMQPSHLVLETDDPIGLRKFLAGHEIYCPIHWPPSDLLPCTEPWPTRYLSLPIDHRYQARDMRRIAAAVQAFFAPNWQGWTS